MIVDVEEGPIIEQILDHKRTDEDAASAPVESTDDDAPVALLYLVRWRGYSHLHNTWEDYMYLKTLKGAKKLDNYVRKLLDEQMWRKDPHVSKEEIEQRDVNLEMHRQTLEDYKTIDRIIAQRKGADGNAEYLVLWKWLGYDEATWESADDIIPDAQPCNVTTQIENVRTP